VEKQFYLEMDLLTQIDWKRNLESDVTSWRDADGKDVKFKPGKTWILLTDKQPVLTP